MTPMITEIFQPLCSVPHPACQPDRARAAVNLLPAPRFRVVVDRCACPPGLSGFHRGKPTAKEDKMISDHNSITRRICEIEGEDDDLTISFVDVDFSILRRAP
jgi:hypothetical protein